MQRPTPVLGSGLRPIGLPRKDGRVSGRAAEAADDPLQRLLQNHGVRSIAWRAAQLPTDQHRDKVAEWLDMLLESVKRPES